MHAPVMPVDINDRPLGTVANPMAVSAGSGGGFGSGEYETVAASQTAQVLGATGATGYYLAGLLVVPATTSPGVVTMSLTTSCC